MLFSLALGGLIAIVVGAAAIASGRVAWDEYGRFVWAAVCERARRLRAWWNADDVAEALTFGQRQFGRVYLRDGRCLPVIEGYSLEAAQRHLEILKEIGASPEAIDLAEQVYEAYQIASRPPVPLDAVEREALNRTPYMGAEDLRGYQPRSGPRNPQPVDGSGSGVQRRG